MHRSVLRYGYDAGLRIAGIEAVSAKYSSQISLLPAGHQVQQSSSSALRSADDYHLRKRLDSRRQYGAAYSLHATILQFPRLLASAHLQQPHCFAIPSASKTTLIAQYFHSVGLLTTRAAGGGLGEDNEW